MTTYGIHIAGSSVGERLDVALMAERAGLDVWTSEFYYRSATVPLAVIAAKTSDCRIGSSIMYGVGRSPVILAAEARDLDELSQGRLVLGLGNGTRRMMSGWHGADPQAPAARMEELVPLLQALWRLDRGPVRHTGRFYDVDVIPTLTVPPPLRERIPVYIAGVNSRMIEAAGRVADGLIGHGLCSADYHASVTRPAIEKGAAHAGRDPAQVELTSLAICSIDDDEEAARRGAAKHLAVYGPVKTYGPVLEAMGFAREGEAMREAFDRGDQAAVVAAVSERMIDALTITGTADQARTQLRRYEGVVDHVILQAPADSDRSKLDAIAAMASPHQPDTIA